MYVDAAAAEQPGRNFASVMVPYDRIWSARRVARARRFALASRLFALWLMRWQKLIKIRGVVPDLGLNPPK